MSVAAAMLRALVEAVEKTGVPKRRFLEAAGVDEARLADPFGRFEFEEYAALHALALDMTQDDALGLHILERSGAASFDILPHLLPMAPTLRDALGACARHAALLVSGSHLTVEESVDVARLRYTFRRSSPGVDRLHAELAVLGLSRLVRVFAGDGVRFQRVSFEHAAPACRAEYRRLFAGSERFGDSFTGLVFQRAWLDSNNHNQQPRTYALLCAEAQRLSTSMVSKGHAERVKDYLMRHLPSRIPKMAEVARELGMSARSLRRRLLEEGLTYRQLVHARLEEAAVYALRTPGTSVAEAAYKTGFSDSAAFHRAFKQWKGVTPTEFQRADRGDSAS